MEHAEAVASKAADRYLLGEMDEDAAEAFEEHFFDCVVCADEVRDDASLFAAGRSVAREGRVVSIAERRQTRWTWLPLAAAAILVLAVGVPMFVVRQPKPLVAVSGSRPLLDDRAEQSAAVIALPKGEAASFFFIVPPGFRSYRWSVASEGKSVATGTVPAQETNDGLNLMLRDLPAGRYELLVEGLADDGKASEVARHPFTIRK